MENLGWIKLHRTLLDSQIWASPEGLKIWMWILLKAHHSEKPLYCEMQTGEGKTTVKVFQGQFIFGRKTAAIELDMSESMVYRWVKKLASNKYCMISEQPHKHFTIIQVNNWKQYQGNNEDKVNNHWTTTEQPLNTNKNGNNVKNGKEDLETRVLEAQAIDIDGSKLHSDTTSFAEANGPISNEACNKDDIISYNVFSQDIDYSIETNIDFGNDFGPDAL